MSTQSAVVVNGLTKQYGRTIALDRICFEVERGEIFGVLGRNGAGKTTLIEILEGIRTATNGSIQVLGFDPGKELDQIKQRVGIQLQASSFFRRLRVIEVIEQFRTYYARRADTEELLTLVALMEKRHSFIADLSGGQRQRLALALALVNDPDIVFLDEPTVGLDPQVRRQLWHTVLQMKKTGKTVFLTTHYIEEAEYLCDRVCIINEGKTIALDSPENLIARPGFKTRQLRFTTARPLSIEHLGDFSPTIASSNGKVSYVMDVENTGPAIVRLVGVVEQQANELIELQIGRVSLEDVFVELTGKEIRQ